MSIPKERLSIEMGQVEKLSAEARRVWLYQQFAPKHRACRIYRVVPLPKLPTENVGRSIIDDLYRTYADAFSKVTSQKSEKPSNSLGPIVIHSRVMSHDELIRNIEEIPVGEHGFIFTHVPAYGDLFACSIPAWSLDRHSVDIVSEFVMAKINGVEVVAPGNQEETTDVSYDSSSLEKIEANPPMEVPIDLPRKISDEGTAYVQRLSLDASVRADDSKLDISVAFTGLLARYCGQEEFNVGIRQRARQMPSQMGHHEDWWISPINVDLSTTFDTVRTQLRDAVEQNSVPFSAVGHRFVGRDLSMHPAFQAGIVFVPPSTADHVRDLEEQLERSTLLDIELRVFQREDGPWDVLLLVAQHIFLKETARQLAAHLELMLDRVLSSSAKSSEGLVWGKPMLDEDDIAYWMNEFNDSDAHVDQENLVHEIFERTAETFPDRIAVKDMQREWTYTTLNQNANRIAKRLISHDVAEDVRVGIFSNRHAYYFASMLGVFKAGGAFIPIDPNYPTERIHHILETGQCDIILYDDENETALIHALGDNNGRLRLSMEQLAKDSMIDNSNISRRQSEDALAYIIFTSGSTGLPKGAMVEQKGMRNHLYAKAFDLGFDEEDRILQNSSQCFDISVFQFFIAGLFGGMVRVVDNDTALDPRKLFDVVCEDKISTVELVPSAGRAALTYRSCVEKIKNATSLRWMILTGEALPPALVNDWLAVAPEVPIMNAYGPTECSDDVAHEIIRNPLPLHAQSTPVGKPIANMRMYVIDKGGHIAPIGVHGELWITGIGVGRGYLNNPERTAKAFVPNTIDGQSARAYKTGDRIRLLHSGSLEFLGRIDHQVKIRGYRIELGEIETALLRHPEISESVVVGVESPSGTMSLAGYFVSPSTLGADEVRVFLANRIPQYMVPQYLIPLSEMPLSPNGKIQRSSLPSPNHELTAAEYHPPSTQLEDRLARIWQDLLSIEQISVDANFFRLGGDSLLAIQLFAHIHNNFGVNLQIARLFETPTIRGLAGVLSRKIASPETSGSVFSEGRYIVPIRVHGAGNQLFCVHGAGGNVLNFYHLANLLPQEIDFFGIQARGVDGRKQPHKSLLEMRDAYFKALQKDASLDNLILAGFSGGGLVALELARLLRENGHTVRSVVLLDTYCPAIERVDSTISEKIEKVRKYGLSYVQERANTIFQRKRTQWELVGHELLGRPLPHNLREQKLFDAFTEGENQYRCRPYDGRVILVRAEEVDEGYRHVAADLGWRRYLSDLYIVSTPGNHETMVTEPHVETLADVLYSALVASL